jgi:cobalamin biosynthesis protein CobW
MQVVERLGPALVRAKGFVRLAGEPRRGFLERAGERTTLALGAPWGADPPRTELVLIGDGLDAAALQRQLWACRAGGVAGES